MTKQEIEYLGSADVICSLMEVMWWFCGSRAFICTSDVDSLCPKRTNYQPIFIVQSGFSRD